VGTRDSFDHRQAAEPLGPVGNFLRASQQQQQQLYGVVDLNVHPRWEINFGIGGGLTRATDGLIIKMILGRRF